MRINILGIGLTVGLTMTFVGMSAAEIWSLHAAGFRLGVSDYEKPDTFVLEEVFAQRALPWRWEKSGRLEMTTAVELSLGHLGADGTDAFAGGVGPVLRGSWAGLPLFIDVGTKATYISQLHFGLVNYGGKAQFVSHFEVGVELGSNWELAYRFQHMSNARVYKPNPGLNLHVLAVQYRF
jgi:hypothetical protein